MLKPLNKYILAKPYSPEKKSGLIVSVKEEKKWAYEVMEVGQEVKCVAKGQKILCAPFRENEIEENGESYILIPEEVVIGIWE